ncbi:response regulator, partial [Streptomyces scabiei]|uniref:response regulator n=1 Tax=Streptomyces scabiei TaxID=1930 RepID=UPI0038F818BF
MERRGMTVDLARDTEEGAAFLHAGAHDALLLDLGLPDGDGLALLRSLRARGMTRPVLLLTARGTVEARIAGLNAGADDY